MATFALLAGAIGYFLSINKVFTLVERLAVQIPSSKHHLFLTAGWAHTTSYIVGILGSIVLVIRIFKKRNKIKTLGHKSPAI
jgi:hypothetical protein